MSARTKASKSMQSTDWPMYRALVGLGLICSLVIVSMYEYTAPIIRKNQAAALRQAIFTIFPLAQTYTAFYLNAEGQFKRMTDESDTGASVYACYDQGQRLLGYAIEAQGMGYQDTIRLLYGYAPKQSAIVGMVVLESRETPGLGARIASDPDFLRNFRQLDVRLAADGSKLAHPIEVVPADQAPKPWQIDAISGATVSSRVVGRIVEQSARFWVPRLANRETSHAP